VIPPEEPILDKHQVSRLLFEPHMAQGGRLHRKKVFQFQEKAGSRKESVVWREVAKSSEAVHELGRSKATADNIENPQRGISYLGFLTAEVAAVRAIQGVEGHSFEVAHFPSEGRHHAHIEMETGTGAPNRQFRNAIKVLLVELFEEMGLIAA